MAQTFKLSQFEGPLDMLLFLVGKAKIDIRDIFVSEITDQYVQSVREATDLDMDDASAFVAMAATLLEIKSRSLLPRPPAPEEEDPEQALIRQLEEYQRFKALASDMRGFEKASMLMFRKLPEEYPLPPPTLELTGLTLAGLCEAFARVCARLPKEEEKTPEERRILRDEFTVARAMGAITRALRKGRVPFTGLFSKRPCREEVVALFLALLEMMRLGRVLVAQSGVYDEIILTAREEREAQGA